MVFGESPQVRSDFQIPDNACAKVAGILKVVLIGPKGRDNLDVIAHEMAHCELHSRRGFWASRRVPTWFDEVLALQVDQRED